MKRDEQRSLKGKLGVHPSCWAGLRAALEPAVAKERDQRLMETLAMAV